MGCNPIHDPITGLKALLGALFGAIHPQKTQSDVFKDIETEIYTQEKGVSIDHSEHFCLVFVHTAKRNTLKLARIEERLPTLRSG